MAYEKVLSEALLTGCVRKENAWNIITDYSKYPSIMDNVDKVEIVERTLDEGLSKWQVSVDEAPLYWIEKDYFNRRDFHVAFKSIEGDFDNINGQWLITDTFGSGIKITFEIEYNLGIPVIEEVLGPVLREKMKTNMGKMVRAIQQELTSKATDERRYARQTVNRGHIARQNGAECELFVLNLSAGGMMIRSAGPIQQGPLQIGVAMLDIAAVVTDETYGRSRIIFTRPLEEEVFASLAENLLLSGKPAPAQHALPQEAIVIPTEQEMPLQLLELTAEGMRFSLQGAELPDLESFTIGSTPLPLKQIVHDDKRNLVSVLFQSPLSSEQMQQVRRHFRQPA